MKDKIYRLYQENKNKEIDQNFLYKVLEEMLFKEKELIPYVKDCLVVEEKEPHLGNYSCTQKNITLNLEKINKSPKANILGIETVRHELEHARNMMILEKGHRDIESLIINYSLKDYALKNDLDIFHNINQLNILSLQHAIKNNYSIDPGERLVEIKAWRYMVNLLKNQRRSEDLLISRSYLMYSYMRGYQENDYYREIPTYQFLLNTRMFYELYWLEKQVKEKDYCLNTRLTYGLPITEEEYDKLIPQKVKLRKRKL